MENHVIKIAEFVNTSDNYGCGEIGIFDVSKYGYGDCGRGNASGHSDFDSTGLGDGYELDINPYDAYGYGDGMACIRKT